MQTSLFLNNLCAAHWSVYLIDALVILTVMVFVVICAKRGFVGCFFGLVSVTVSILAAVSFSKLLLDVTGGIFGLRTWFEGVFTNAFSKRSGFDFLISSEGMETAISNGDLSAVLANLAMKWFAKGEFPADTTVAMVLGQVSARILCLLIVGLVVFGVSMLLFLLLRKVLGVIIEKITLLNALDAILGAIVGFTAAVLLISVTISLVSLIPSQTLANYFSQNSLVGWIYNHNPLMWFVGLFL